MKMWKRWFVISVLLLFALNMTSIAFESDLNGVVLRLKEMQLKASEELTSSKVQQKVIVYQGSEQLEVEVVTYKQGQKIRIDSKGEAYGETSESTVIYDGEKYYHLYAGLVKELSQEDLGENLSTTNWIELATRHGQGVQDEMLNDQSCYLISGTVDGKPFKVWVEQDTLNLLQLEMVDSKERQIWMRTQGYSQITENVQIPSEILIYIDGEIKSERYLESIEVNPELPESYFDPHGEKFNLFRIIKDLF